MADKKISQLTDGTSFQSGDEAVVNRSGTNYKVDPTQFGSNIHVTGTVTATEVITRERSSLGSTASPVTDQVVGLNAGGNFAAGVIAINTNTSNFDVSLGFVTRNASGAGVERVRIDGDGNVGINTDSPSEALDVSGNTTISGSLSKGSGSFKIDHPVKPETHYLIHSFVEAPQADNIYRGKVVLVNGLATVNIDAAVSMTEGTFVLLNREVQCFTSNETGWTAVRGRMDDNILTIEAQDSACADTISWMVVGERQDQHMYDTSWTDENGKVIVEPLKEEQ